MNSEKAEKLKLNLKVVWVVVDVAVGAFGGALLFGKPNQVAK